jgi:hypothetical protein
MLDYINTWEIPMATSIPRCSTDKWLWKGLISENNKKIIELPHIITYLISGPQMTTLFSEGAAAAKTHFLPYQEIGKS